MSNSKPQVTSNKIVCNIRADDVETVWYSHVFKWPLRLHPKTKMVAAKMLRVQEAEAAQTQNLCETQEFLTIMRSNWFKCKLLESARHTAAGLALS